MPMFRLWHERVRTAAGVAAFYGLLAVVVMSPLAAQEMPATGAMDLGNHVSGVIEAGNALAEGQFPIRVAPNQVDKGRYPIFQFYGNLPYTFGGILYQAGVDPYEAWKLVVWAALVVGAFFLYRCARRLTRQFWPAVVAGAVFLTAPYTLTDLHGRVAFSELISLCLLPIVFFYLSRTFATGRRGSILLGAVAWSCLALTHNVTFFVASQLFPLFLLLHFRRTRRYFRRLLAVGLSYGLALGLSAWYMAPQLYLLDSLAGGLQFPLHLTDWLTPLGVLLAPRVMPPVPLPTNLIFHPGQFGLQVGWVILAGVFVCGHGWYSRRFGVYADRRNAGVLLLLFGLTFVLVWSPVDFWEYFPPLYQFIQFSYRLLMFVVLFGALLVALALKLYFVRGMRYEHAVACLLGVGAYLGWSLEPHRAAPPGYCVADEIANPNIGRGGANGVYRLSMAACLENMRRDPMPSGFTYARSLEDEVPVEVAHGHPVVITLKAHEPRFVKLPVLYYPKVLEVRLNSHRVDYRNLGAWVAVTVPAGEHRLTIGFAGLEWANYLSVAAWSTVLLGLGAVAVAAWRRRFRRREHAPFKFLIVKESDSCLPRRISA
jgi:hypothetical protein